MEAHVKVDSHDIENQEARRRHKQKLVPELKEPEQEVKKPLKKKAKKKSKKKK